MPEMAAARSAKGWGAALAFDCLVSVRPNFDLPYAESIDYRFSLDNQIRDILAFEFSAGRTNNYPRET